MRAEIALFFTFSSIVMNLLFLCLDEVIRAYVDNIEKEINEKEKRSNGTD